MNWNLRTNVLNSVNDKISLKINFRKLFTYLLKMIKASPCGPLINNSRDNIMCLFRGGFYSTFLPKHLHIPVKMRIFVVDDKGNRQQNIY